MPTGKNKVPMAQLRQVLTDEGFSNVRTWIQSGNVVLETEISPQETEEKVHHLILKYIGPDLVSVVRTGDELTQVIDENPFAKGYDISRVFFALFKETPAKDKIAKLLRCVLSPEKLAITDKAAYMYIPGTYGRGKLSSNYLEKQLGVGVTMRNFNTMTKLIELSKEQ